MSEFSIIGKPVAFVDAAEKTTGAGKYTDDLSVPGMLIGKILHSPYPHALIKHIDTTRALALDGVVAVVIGKDAPNKYGILPVGHDETALAVEKVRYVGDNVACVAAVDEATAEKALELIDVDYELLPAWFDPEDHIVVVCHHGVRSLNVTAWLRLQGFERAQSMQGGIDRWSREVDRNIPTY